MDDLQEKLLSDIYQGSLSVTGYLPGPGVTQAQVRYSAMLIADHLGVSDEEIVEMLQEPIQDTEPGKLAMGFAGQMMLNLGNGYGFSVVERVLKSFVGKEVSIEVAELLQRLEKSLEVARGEVS